MKLRARVRSVKETKNTSQWPYPSQRIQLFRSGGHCEVFLVSLTDRTLARNFINEFSHLLAVQCSSAQRARHCGLSKSVLLGAHWLAVCF